MASAFRAVGVEAVDDVDQPARGDAVGKAEHFAAPPSPAVPQPPPNHVPLDPLPSGATAAASAAGLAPGDHLPVGGALAPPEVIAHEPAAEPPVAGVHAATPPSQPQPAEAIQPVEGIVLLADAKAQCPCGSIINRSSIYRHAIAGDGRCSGGQTLTVEQLMCMKEITFTAKANYMRSYREKKPGSDRRRRPWGPSRRRLSGGVPPAGGGVGPAPLQDVGSPGTAAAAVSSAAMVSVDGMLQFPTAAAAHDPSSGMNVVPAVAAAAAAAAAAAGEQQPQFVEEMSTCPVADCGKTCRSRNLYEHVSSKSCRGGHLLSLDEVNAIKTIAKNARAKYNSARKIGLRLPKNQPNAAGVIGDLSISRMPNSDVAMAGTDEQMAMFASPGPVSDTLQGGVANMQQSAGAGPILNSPAPLPSAGNDDDGVKSTQSPSIAPPTPNVQTTAALRTIQADDPLLDIKIRDIGVAMARSVARGHPEAEKRELEEQIIAGVEAYRLTATVLCARRPPSELLARRILSQRFAAHADEAEDGVFWAVVDFIERSRSGEFSKVIGPTPS